jgi:predicted  nucleic acid-binding Zn-ribbon protein
MESELLKQLQIESDASNETINRLRTKIEKLKSLKSDPKSDDEIIKDLQEENRKLKEQVEELKKELISLDEPVASLSQVNVEEPEAKAVESKPVQEPKQGNKEAKEKKPKGKFYKSILKQPNSIEKNSSTSSNCPSRNRFFKIRHSSGQNC